MNSSHLYYPISGLINAFTSIILGFFVLSRNKTSIKHITYALFCLSIAVWSIFYFVWLITDSRKIALLCSHGFMAGAIFIPIFYLHHILALLQLNLAKRKIILVSYISGAVFSIFNLTPYFITDVQTRLSFKYWPTAGHLFSIFLPIWVFFVIYGAYEIMKAHRNSTGIEKNRMRYVLIATVIGWGGGATNYPLWYDIPLPPFLNILVSGYIVIVAYAILRHQLMDIEVIIKKTVVFAGMFTFAFGIFVAIALLVSQLIAGGNTLLAFAISAFIITLLLRPLETWLINSTNKFLFQKKYEYKQIIKAFVEQVITELNLDKIVSSTLKLLDQTIHPYSAGIFILNQADDKYRLYNAYGLEDKNITFGSESKLITFLRKASEPALIKQTDGVSAVNPEIVSEMNKLKAVIALPFLLHNDLIGFMFLGRKKSDEEYAKDDLDVLLDLSRTESIAVGNAQLLTEAAQAERRAAIGTMAAGINHEIGNPLNIITTKIQFFLLSKQRGYFKDKSREEILEECGLLLDETLKQTNRIVEITKKLSNFAKPSREFRPQTVNILEEIEETLAMLGHELELEKIRIEKEISPDVPKILADRQELRQILFNLIRNAAQAIEEKGQITLRALSTANGRVRIEIQDTGKGIPEDKRQRIFEPFFTTKGSAKGTGLGLSIVRQLVWKNRGEITFKSQEGAGTSFILEFPKANEKSIDS